MLAEHRLSSIGRVLGNPCFAVIGEIDLLSVSMCLAFSVTVSIGRNPHCFDILSLSAKVSCEPAIIRLSFSFVGQWNCSDCVVYFGFSHCIL